MPTLEARGIGGGHALPHRPILGRSGCPVPPGRCVISGAGPKQRAVRTQAHHAAGNLQTIRDDTVWDV